MHRIVRLENPIRRYAWGSRTFLARLQGRPFPTPEPEAELWVGAHPAAPSRVVTEAAPVPLPEWIARDPEGILGPEVAARFGGELPFLVKILAVEQPLSVQVHPDAEQARAGFEREEAAGIARDAPHRSYPDPRAKPELIYALTPFEALVGLRPAREVLRDLETLQIPALRPVLEALEGPGGGPGGEGEALRRAFATLLGWPAAERRALVAAVADAARRRGAAAEGLTACGTLDRPAPARPGRREAPAGSEAEGPEASADACGEGGPALAWAARLAEAWPEDPLVLAPLLLHHVRLAPGATLFVAPGTLHAYLAGAAVEVQASSDNVLRAGLTGKHVDPEELLRVARVEAGEPRVRDARVAMASAPLGGPCGSTAVPIALRMERLSVGSPRIASSGDAVRLLLCIEGRVDVEGGEGAPVTRIALEPGAACLVPGSAGPHQLSGSGRLVSTTVQSGA